MPAEPAQPFAALRLTEDEEEAVLVHATLVYQVLHDVRFSAAMRAIRAEMRLLALTASGAAAMRYLTDLAGQCLPPAAESPALHAGVRKLRTILGAAMA